MAGSTRDTNRARTLAFGVGGTLVALGLVVVSICMRGARPEPAGLVRACLADFERVEVIDRRRSIVHVLRRGDLELRLELIRGVDTDSARILEDDGVMGIEALYANALSPYPGDISKRIVVNEAYRPRLVRAETPAGPRAYFILFANDRRGFGAGTRESVAWKALVGWLHCPGPATFYRVRCFAPPDTPDETLEAAFFGLACDDE